MISALLSALAGAGNLIIDKIILTRERVALKVYLPILFIFLFGFTALLYPYFGSVDWGLAKLTSNLFMLFLMIIIAVSWNVLFYQSIQQEKVHQHEMIVMTSPLITTILAALFYPEELRWQVFYLTLIASSALIFAKYEKKHLELKPVTINLLLAVVLMSTESIIIRELLYSYTPVALYAIRTLFIALFFMVYYQPCYRQVSFAHWRLIALTALIGVVQMVGRFYAFEELGIIMTTLITILGPLIIFLASWQLLHEKIKPRVMLASIVIIICLVLAVLITYQ